MSDRVIDFTLTRAQILEALQFGGTFVRFNIPEPVIVPEQVDRRPFGWKNFIGYRFVSATGSKRGHEVTLTRNPTQTACDCAAGLNDRKCWARKAVEKKIFESAFRITLPQFIFDRATGEIVSAVDRRPDFGNRKA